MRLARHRRPPRRGVALVLAAAAIVLVGCSEEEPTDFTADNRSGFMAACSRPIEDTRLVSEICQCVFDVTQEELSFSDFDAIDEQLVEDPDLELPAELTAIIADCVIEETGL